MRRALVIAFVLIIGCSDGPVVPDAAPHLDERGHITPLACPGDIGCAQAEGVLRVGVAAEVITPNVEPWEDANDNGRFDEGEVFEDRDGDGQHDDVWMAGFSVGRAATGIADDNWARAVVFERGDLRVGLVSLDLIGYFNDDVISIRDAAASAGLAFDHLLIASTHQHEGQDTMGPWGGAALETGRDPDYQAYIVTQTVRALTRATDTLTTSRLRVATATAPELIHDSRQPIVIDPTITTLQAIGDDDEPFMSLVIWGNHPEALSGDNTLVTSDYPHYLRERLEAAYPGSTTVFFSGTLGGLMNPLHIVGCPDADGVATCEEGSFELATYIGHGVADRVVSSLAKSSISDDLTLAVRRQPFDVTIGNFRFFGGYIAGLFDRRIFDETGRSLPRSVAQEVTVDDALAGKIRFQSEVNALTLGPLEIITVPGEIYPELWLAPPDGTSFIVQNADVDFPDAPLEPPLITLMPGRRVQAIVNQGNDALGYIMPKVQYDFEEPYAFGRLQYGEVNSVGPDIAPQIAQAIEKMYRAP